MKRALTSDRHAPHLHARPVRHDPAWLALRLPRVPSGPVPGYVLIADRNNNRVLLVSPSKRVVWEDTRLRGPDDAFFTPGWRSIITNEEFNDTLRQVSLRTSRVVWSYGHATVAGSSPGYLNTPDDAYRISGGRTTVADIRNCRILTISQTGKIDRVLGGSCSHDPPLGFASPNGDTPLPDGGLLVTEIGGYIDRLDARGRLMWSVRSPVAYPSDAQLLPSGRILVASFTSPGRIVELTRSGRVTWSFGSTSGPDELNQPSLAVRWPNGMIAANDDYNERVIVIDPVTKRIVWQYGHLGVASSAAGFLDKPDGIDLLPAARLPVAEAATAGAGHTPHIAVSRVGSLPAPASRLAVAALSDGRVMVLGGLVNGSSSTQILEGTPQHLVSSGHLPVATHDDAAVALRGSVFLFGGGQIASSDAIVRISPTGHAATVGSIGEPLSDLGATRIGGTAYLVGGYTGSQYATGILAYVRGRPVLVARLPVGLRYAGVATLSGRVYVAGGVTTGGDSDAIYAFDPSNRRVTRIGTLPAPVAHAPLVAADGALYLVGGDGAATVTRILPDGRASIAGRLDAPLSGAAAIAVRHTIYLFGGIGSNAVLRLDLR